MACSPRIVGSVELFCSDCHLVCTFPPSLLVPENIFSEKLIFLKRRAGYQGTSVIGIECFSVWFWLCLVVLFITLTIATLLQAWRLCRLNTIKERVGYPFVVPPSLFPPLLPHSHSPVDKKGWRCSLECKEFIVAPYCMCLSRIARRWTRTHSRYAFVSYHIHIEL